MAMRDQSKRVLLAVAVLAALLTLACGPARAAERLAISYVPGNAIYWDIDVAIEKGFFREEGFEPEIVVFQSSPQSIQLLISGEVHLAGAQPEVLLAAVAHGSRGFAVISSPAERADWFLVGRPGINSLADVKGGFFGTGGLQVGENWWTWKLLARHGVAREDVNVVQVGTSALKFAALQRGSIAFAVLFQPTAQQAAALGMTVLHRFSDGEAFPSILYSVGERWAREGEHGRRLSRALVRAHHWLHEPGNRAEAIAILHKHTKRDPEILAPVYDLYVGPGGILSRDGAVDIASVERVIALMAEYGTVAKGAALAPSQYLLPKELGGLAR
jgi:ABC-type nitrate/sulfonate/bicarbonate transport system substrate-binding protein